MRVRPIILNIFRCGRIFLFLILFLSFSGSAFGSDRFEKFKERTRDRFSGVSWVSVEKLLEWMGEKPGDQLILLDVRSPEEFEVSHLAGARLTPGLDEARLLLVGESPEQLIVTYCSVGYRSAVLAEELEEIGFANVHNLEGSLFEWANRGYPIFQQGKRVRKAHFYNFWWGMYLKKELWAW